MLGLLLSALAVALLSGHGPWAGPKILTLTPGHGVNLGDLPVLGLWMGGLACCWMLWRD